MKGINHGTNAFANVAGLKQPILDMEMRDIDTMLDNLVDNPSKAYAAERELDRKRADGTYETMQAIRDNPAPLVKVYREMKKQGKL